MSEQKPVLRVEWEDSASCAKWFRPEELEGFAKDPFVAVSVGIEVYRDDKALVLAGQINSEGWSGCLTRIPIANIRKELLLQWSIDAPCCF